MLLGLRQDFVTRKMVRLHKICCLNFFCIPKSSLRLVISFLSEPLLKTSQSIVTKIDQYSSGRELQFNSPLLVASPVHSQNIAQGTFYSSWYAATCGKKRFNKNGKISNSQNMYRHRRIGINWVVTVSWKANNNITCGRADVRVYDYMTAKIFLDWILLVALRSMSSTIICHLIAC